MMWNDMTSWILSALYYYRENQYGSMKMAYSYLISDHHNNPGIVEDVEPQPLLLLKENHLIVLTKYLNHYTMKCDSLKYQIHYNIEIIELIEIKVHLIYINTLHIIKKVGVLYVQLIQYIIRILVKLMILEYIHPR